MADILTLERVSKALAFRHRRVEAVRRIDLRVQEHELVTVVGASGCGKSTLVVGEWTSPSSGSASGTDSGCDGMEAESERPDRGRV